MRCYFFLYGCEARKAWIAGLHWPEAVEKAFTDRRQGLHSLQGLRLFACIVVSAPASVPRDLWDQARLRTGTKPSSNMSSRSLDRRSEAPVSVNLPLPLFLPAPPRHDVWHTLYPLSRLNREKK